MNRRSTFLVTAILILNALVYLMWTFPRFFDGYLQPEFMAENFLVSWDALSEGRWWVLLTSAFSHSLFIHLLLNMLVLLSFGSVLEIYLGHRFFLVFYLVAAVFSSFAHAAVSAFVIGAPQLPALGASGAMAGCILLFSLLFPREKILLFGLIPVPAIFGAIGFVGLDLWGLSAQAHGGGLPIGHGAHLGGSFIGLMTYFLFVRGRKPKVRIQQMAESDIVP